MEAMMALSLASIGERLANKVIDTVGAVVSGGKTSAQTFDSALSTASAQATGVDAASLARTQKTLESTLRKDPDVANFTGGKSFHLVQSGDGYAIKRADGDLWKLPAGSAAEKTAKELFNCHISQENAKGNPATGLRSEWLVEGETPARSILHAV